MTVVRFLHILALALFVGGQLALVVVVVPVMRRRGDDEAMRAMGMRFGIASVAALVVLLATGAIMASDLDRWDDGTLQIKLALVGVVLALTSLHAVLPNRRALSIAVFALSLAIVWLGVSLAH